MYNTLVINVDELWLKGKNRPLYYRAIKGHIKYILKREVKEAFELNNQGQRLVASFEQSIEENLLETLLKIPGIHSIYPAMQVESDINLIVEACSKEVEQLDGSPVSFKIQTKRSNKKFPMNSMEISREVGHLLLEKHSHLKVDVHHPQLLIDVKILANGSYISSKKYLGIGGLPVGMSGHLITLLSAGFDSPVASYLMSKRGCKQTFIFFYAYPFVGDEVKEKIVDLYKVLSQYQIDAKLYIIPFGDVQSEISKGCKVEYRTLLFRYYMLASASLLAQKLGADALLTGDSLGQVSSQTIGNISLLDSLSSYSVFRPLLGHNKVEIIDLARTVGTHDISVIPHDDACSLFAPKHPVIKPDKLYLKKFVEMNPMDAELEKALLEAEIIEYS